MLTFAIKLVFIVRQYVMNDKQYFIKVCVPNRRGGHESNMENFAVDLDKLLDDFELDEGQWYSWMGIS